MKIREMIRLLEKIENSYGSEVDVKGFDLDSMDHYDIDNITFDADFGNVVYIEVIPEEDDDD